MEQNDMIWLGDTVDVVLTNEAKMLNATVLYIPFATGDSWRIRTEEGELVYLQNFAFMRLVRKAGSI